MRANLALLLGAAAVVALTALTGFSDAIDPLVIQDQLAISSGALDGNAVGQTFLFHFPRLHSIQIAWIVSNDFQFRPGAQVTLHLRAQPNDTSDLASSSIPLEDIQNNAFSRFTFAPLPDSENQSYYFSLTLPNDAITHGALALWSSADDAYSDGALLINGKAASRDLAFRAYYEPDLGMLAGALVSTSTRFGAGSFVFIALVLFTAWLATRRLPKTWFVALGLGALCASVVALEQIRDLGAPLWVDSLTHAGYVQFILDHARLPAKNFYHLDFHLLTALFSKISDLSVSQSLLLVGQFTWVLVGITIFVLSRKISGSAIAGLVAAICIWFLSPTPAYFITWGRYPLVLGAAILPIALLYAMELVDQPRPSARTILLAAITFALLAFSQIRLSAFYVAFVAIYSLVSFRRSGASEKSLGSRTSFPPSAEGCKPALAIGARVTSRKMTYPVFFIFVSFILLFALLWLGALAANGVGIQKIVAENASQPSIDLQTAIDVSVTHHGPELWLFSVAAIILGVARRSRVVLLLLGWFGVIGAIALIPPVIGELVQPSLIVLMAFLPAALLVGDAAGWIYKRSRLSRRFVHATVWGAAIVCVSVIGARDMVSIANPATILFTRADANAMRWIHSNLPAHSTFLVNSFNWVGSTFIPSDGGGWMPYFTNNSVAYVDASTLKGDSESILSQWIELHKINYIYLGARAGILNASDFLSHPERYLLIYNRDSVKIFQIK